MSDISPHLPYLLQEALLSTHILELGSRGGCSTSAFLLACAENEMGQVMSIDIDPMSEVWIKEKCGPMCQYWTFLCGDSTHQNVIEEARKRSPYDIVFIDSSHEASQTKIELEEYSAMLRVGGKIILHDTEEANIYWNEGVRKPMMKFLEEHSNFKLERDVTNSHGLTTLMKIDVS